MLCNEEPIRVDLVLQRWECYNDQLVPKDRMRLKMKSTENKLGWHQGGK